MIKKSSFAVWAGSLDIVIYCICLQDESTLPIAWFLFSTFPLVICWVGLTIIRFDKYEGPELNGEEWGYQDKPKSDPGML